MCAYKIVKREECVSPSASYRIQLGDISDKLDSIKALCNDRMNEISKSIDLEVGEARTLYIWGEIYYEREVGGEDFLEIRTDTEGTIELIGKANFFKDNSGNISYSIDYSESTL